MKIRRVEIAAFRIFEDPKDAIFDFTTTAGETADFISIYAPNGFGKTSFYDAVEWCITKDIHRFHQHGGETTESLNVLSETSADKKIRLLKNTKVPKDTPTYVKINCDNGKDIEEKLEQLRGRSKNDLPKKNDSINPFKQVILSQEWISAFLKEEDGENRYKIFMRNPGLADLSGYYNKLSSLITANATTIDTLTKTVFEEKQKTSVLEEGNLLEAANALVSSIQKDGETIQPVTIHFTDKQVLDFFNKIVARSAELGQKATLSEQAIQKIEQARAGNENLPGLTLYTESLANKAKADDSIKSINETIDKFETLNKTINEISAKQEQNKSLSRQADSLKDLQFFYLSYESIRDSINNKNVSVNEERELLKEVLQDLSEAKKEEAELRGKLVVANNTISQLTEKIEHFPAFSQLYAALQDQLANCEKRIADLSDSETGYNLKIQKTQSEITDYKFLMDLIEKSAFKVAPPESLIHFKDAIKELNDKKEKLDTLIAEITKNDEKIKQQEGLSTLLKEFIERGIGIVNDSKMSACPLCTHEYASYEELAGKIYNNAILGDLLQDLLLQKTALQNQQSILTAEYNAGVVSIKDRIKTSIDSLDNTLGNWRRENQGNLQQLKDAGTELLRIKGLIAQAQTELNGLSADSYREKLESDFKALEDERQFLTQLHGQGLSKINQNEEHKLGIEGKIKVITEEVEQLKKDVNYVKIQDWFASHAKGQEINKIFLEQGLSDVNENITIEEDKLNKIDKQRLDLLDDLKAYDLKQLKEDKVYQEKQRENSIKSLETYENYFVKEFSVTINGRSTDYILAFLLEKEQQEKSNVKKELELKSKYDQLSGLSNNLLPFLHTEKEKAQLKIDEDELTFLIGKVEPFLKSEKQRIATFLEHEIESFFFTDLINQLYNKIDPHPDFKSVEFKVNFELENPRLDIFVINNDDKQRLIPNLYFSTAQINILSLCIFLATALSSKEYNCIFIDDPIQSMDSINVLSTIDLLRSIIVNLKKQIILSTHDENFHNLLQRKMPTSLFKSRFIELETFGKVKQG